MKIELFLCAILFLLFACQDRPQSSPAERDKSILEASSLHKYFVKSHPDRQTPAWAFHDVNNDNKNDLIIIYRISGEKNAMRVVLSEGETYAITNDVPAPVSNQIITFKDIDEKPPVEFIVQGMKGSRIGYAVYRIEKGKLINLFGEGMGECC